jgi:uncharacterized protein YigE (DUF2233 family)
MQRKIYTAFFILSIGSIVFMGLIPDPSGYSYRTLTEGELISVDTLMQYRIDSIEPLILAYHSFIQKKKDLRGEVIALRTLNDSLFQRLKQPRIGDIPKLDLIDSLQDLFDNNEKRIQLLTNTIDSLSKTSVPYPDTVVNGKSFFDTYLHPGSSPMLRRFRFHGNAYVVCLVSARHNAIRIHPNTTHRLRPLRYTWKMLERNGNRPIMVVNGGMYEKDGSPVGLLISKGIFFHKVDRSDLPVPDNFHLYPNGIFYSDKRNRFFISSTKEYLLTGKKQIQYATQSGPMLLMQDSIHPSFIYGSSNLHFRNGVGVVEGSDRSVVAFVISESKVSFYDMALVYKYILNCKDALYLDGSISRMYFKKGNSEIGDLGGELGPVISVSEK